MLFLLKRISYDYQVILKTVEMAIAWTHSEACSFCHCIPRAS